MRITLLYFAWLLPCPLTQATAIGYLTWRFFR
jgi:hypothetical protein